MEYLNFRTKDLRIFLEMTPPSLFLGLMGHRFATLFILLFQFFL